MCLGKYRLSEKERERAKKALSRTQLLLLGHATVRKMRGEENSTTELNNFLFSRAFVIMHALLICVCVCVCISVNP